jgi:hypothetical protein
MLDQVFQNLDLVLPNEVQGFSFEDSERYKHTKNRNYLAKEAKR